MGQSDLEAMQRGEIDSDGEGMTKAGKILGMISVAWFCFLILIVIVTGGIGACVAALSGR